MRQQAAVIHESMRKEVALKLSEEKEMFPMLDKLIEELQKLNKQHCVKREQSELAHYAEPKQCH